MSGIYIQKYVTKRAKELESNIGYGFYIAHLLRLMGVQLTIRTKVHRNTYLFMTKPKKKKKRKSQAIATTTTTSVSSIVPLTVVIARAKRKRLTKAK